MEDFHFLENYSVFITLYYNNIAYTVIKYARVPSSIRKKLIKLQLYLVLKFIAVEFIRNVVDDYENEVFHAVTSSNVKKNMTQPWIGFYVLNILLSVSASVDGQKVNKSCECGIGGKSRRIVGGTTVQPHEYPWLVSLMLGPKLHCGGAIITDQHVLTAGHCITFGVHYRDLTVYVGMHDRLDNTFATLRIANGVKHPAFVSNAVRDINDIAVLTLNKKLKFSHNVRPICLPTEGMEFKNLPLTVAGWGKTRQGALTSSRYLLETKVQIVDSDKCRKSSIYRDNLVPDTMMCAYSLGKDACQGDSGGPLFSTHRQTHNKKWYQVGIVSWGIDCAMPDYPGVYTIVSKYIQWIKQQTTDGMYCE